MSNSVTKLHIMRLLLAAGVVALVMLVLPRADHQSYSYEENQPWKYPLLTAEFDTPIYRDSLSTNRMRDSIDSRFVPFVKRLDKVGQTNVERFATGHVEGISTREHQILTLLLQRVYAKGVVSTQLYNRISRLSNKELREADNVEDDNTVKTMDASGIYSEATALTFIDSAYNHTEGVKARLTPTVVKAITSCIHPNMVMDTVADSKYRSQEYLSVNAALGVIKKGQRIVDRGEIVTPQIYTILNTYQEMLSKTQGSDNSPIFFSIGQALYIIICIAILYIYLMLYRPKVFGSLKKMTFLMSYMVLFVVFAIEMFEYVQNGLYLVPFAAVPVVIAVFFDSRTAVFSLLITVLITAIVATFPLTFIFMQTAVGLCATFSIRQLSRRSQLLRTALITFAGYLICYVTVALLTDGNFHGMSWRGVAIFGINSVLLSFAYILIFVIEKVFGFTSTVTLVELSDINNPILRKMAEVAPGTFQHSMQVSTLASEAARAIGANTQLVRTGALYHDIGKMQSPVFFTENQHGVNPHAGLSPETSAKKIISHVTDGLEMAQHEKLPEVIRDFIAEHHGRGITRYFYNTAVNESPDGNVDIENFRYPGPNPQSKETAILMMADAVEAASRSLKEYSQENIDKLVDNIINTQQNDGLFRDSPISYRDVETIKNTFKKRLATVYHTRIAYPDVKK